MANEAGQTVHKLSTRQAGFFPIKFRGETLR